MRLLITLLMAFPLMPTVEEPTVLVGLGLNQCGWVSAETFTVVGDKITLDPGSIVSPLQTERHCMYVCRTRDGKINLIDYSLCRQTQAE